MKTLYLDCGMGAAGDMISAALMDLLPDPESFIREINELGIPGVHVSLQRENKCGFEGNHVIVCVHGHEEGEETGDHHDHHHHSDVHAISHIVMELPLPYEVCENVMSVYNCIAQAESHAHGVPVSEVHFHEVGAMDAVADIVMACMLFDRIAPDEIISSPVCVGSGTVKCAHGILPVPAPATAYILRDIPNYSGDIQSELCTPTGAAILKHFVKRFVDQPPIQSEKTGIGMGKKDFAVANCLRAVLCES